MRKITKAICALFLALTACGFVGCKEETPNQAINSFESYDDVRLVRMCRASGSLSVNTDARYVSDGNASMKFTVDYPTYLSEHHWVTSNFSAQYPVDATAGVRFLAKKGYNSLAEISAFQMYVHNANEYDTTLIFTARDSSNAVLFYDMQPLKAEEGRTLTFTVRGNVGGATVASYELAFYGAKKGEFYVDGFTAIKGAPSVATYTHSGNILDFDSAVDMDKVYGLSNTFLPTTNARFNQNSNFAQAGYSLRLDKLGVSGKEHFYGEAIEESCALGNGFSIDEGFVRSLRIPVGVKIKADVYVMGEQAETVHLLVGDGVNVQTATQKLSVGAWQTVEVSTDRLAEIAKLTLTLSTADAKRDSAIFVDNIRYE